MVNMVAEPILAVFVVALILSSTAKIGDFRSIQKTVGAVLPLGPRVVAVTTGSLVAGEWILGAALAISSGSIFFLLAVGFLFVLFAVVGAYALISGRQIHCSCFGSSRSRGLGWSQILLLPLVVGGLVVIAALPPRLEIVTGILLLLAAHLLAAGVFLGRTFTVWRVVRAQRASLGLGARFSTAGTTPAANKTTAT